MTQSDKTAIAVMQVDVSYIKDKIDAVDNKVSNHYVTKEEFEPIRKIVYGLVGLILIAVVGALLALVINGGTK